MAIKFSHQSNMKTKFLEKSTLFKQNYLTLCSLAKLRDWGSRVSIKFIEIMWVKEDHRQLSADNKKYKFKSFVSPEERKA